ncbi:Tautomerase/MIF [Rhizopogon vinicolor AM-OR11-026]|uniref:L-dopachrome isomerase n=1 Tax=Rhizopogon vinicolor AM-OR11-026 TaxID=1314800 RepID=A0A1B7MX93_9AGAM|nr:Tautomerase/MIF [Rhizopogon vinicolor AM-OR11-026]
MPLITLTTNVKFDSEEATKAFVREFSKFCATTIGKDEKVFNVNFLYNPYLAFGGTFDPALMLNVASLFNVNAENAIVWTKAFTEFFEEKLGVPSDREQFAFSDPGAEFLGTKGTTVAESLRAAT